MTDVDLELDPQGTFLAEESQTAVWLLGGLAQVRVPSEVTRNTFTVVQHTGKRGYTTPLHTHDVEDEVFIVLDGQLRMVCDGHERLAEAGTTVVIPHQVPHGFIAVSEEIRFLTIHCTPHPGDRPQFDRFLAEQMPAASAPRVPTPEDVAAHPGPDLDEIIALGEKYKYAFAGPPPTL